MDYYHQQFKANITSFDLHYALFEATKASGASIFGHVDHQFYPQGYSLLILLGESHSAVHYSPETQEIDVELASCSEKIDHEAFFRVFAELIRQAERRHK